MSEKYRGGDLSEVVSTDDTMTPTAVKVVDICEAVDRAISNVVNPISRYLCYASATISMCMALGIIVDLFSRFLLNYPLTGMIEYETYMLVIMGFLSLAYTMIKEGHVSVDLIATKFSSRMKSLLGSIFSVWAVFLFLILSWQLAVRTSDAYKSGEAAVVTAIPNFPFYIIAAFGCLMISLVLLANVFRNISATLTNFGRGRGWILIPIGLISIGLIVLPPLFRSLSLDIGQVTVGIIVICLLLIIMLLGFPVAFTMGLTGFLGLWYLMGIDLTLKVVKMNAYDSVSHYFFCVVPFFILMGFLCLKSGVGARLYRAGSKWFGRLPGGLAIGTIFGCGGFAAICGESMATAATMGSVSLPEMKKYNYDNTLAAGAVAAGGTLGILIPPSIGFIVYGIVTEESIAKLFIAGFIPGIILTTFFALAVYLRCKINPTLGPKVPPVPLREMLGAFKDVWQVALLFAVVIGGIYMGIITPTEAGGVGVIGALIIALFAKEFTWQGFLEAILTSTQMTAMIFTIVISVTILGYFITMTDIPMQFASYISGLSVSRYTIFVLILLLYLVLGMLMNIIPMMMLTLPILFPTVKALGFDPIWFGVIMVIMMEMGQITPPIGINVFVIYGVAKDIPMGKIFMGILPFIVVEIIVIFLLTLFPEVVLLLPNAMDVLAPIK